MFQENLVEGGTEEADTEVGSYPLVTCGILKCLQNSPACSLVNYKQH